MSTKRILLGVARGLPPDAGLCDVVWHLEARMAVEEGPWRDQSTGGAAQRRVRGPGLQSGRFRAFGLPHERTFTLTG